MPEIAGFLWSLEALASCLDAGRLWVITGSGDRPAGPFLIMRPGWPRPQGLPAVTLTTFAEVPWNAPYYLRCGFREVDGADVTPGLRAIRQREDVVLHQWPRVCMRRDPAHRDLAMPS